MFKRIFSSEKMINSRVANVFGVQVSRMVLARVFLRARRKYNRIAYDRPLNELSKKGFYIIPDFLTEKLLAEVKQEFELALSDVKPTEPDAYGVSLKTISFSTQDNSKFPISVKSILGDERILQIMANYLGRKPSELLEKGAIKARFEEASLSDENTGSMVGKKIDRRSNCNLHKDTCFPLIKFFFYLNDIDQTNGAHVYVSKSHCVSIKNIGIDYLNSVTAMEPALRVSDETASRFGFQKISLNFPENTLVADDPSGLHARGEFSDESKKRRIVYIEYRTPPFLP